MTVRYTAGDFGAHIVLDRPAKLNALGPSFWPQMHAALDRAEADGVRCVVLSGAGRAFCAGGDIAVQEQLSSAAQRRNYVESAFGLFERLAGIAVPTIAAVHGHAAGGGCELAVACDLVVADSTAIFSAPEARNVGTVPGFLCTAGVGLIARPWLSCLVLAGGSLSADEARLAGLVNYVTPPGEHLSRAEQLSQQICSLAPDSVRAAKALMLAARPSPGYSNAIDAVVDLLAGEEHRRRATAFLE